MTIIPLSQIHLPAQYSYHQSHVYLRGCHSVPPYQHKQHSQRLRGCIQRLAATRVPASSTETPQRCTLPPLLPNPIRFLSATPTTPHPAKPHHHPNIIDPDDDDPIIHQCPLHLHQQAYAIQQVHQLFEHSEGNAVINKFTGTMQEYRHLIHTPVELLWTWALADHLGKLAQGVGTQMKKGTNTIRFVPHRSVPTDRKVVYARIITSLRPRQKKIQRMQVAVSGDKLEYTGVTITQTSSITTTTCLINITLFTPNTKFMLADIKDCYYGIALPKFE